MVGHGVTEGGGSDLPLPAVMPVYGREFVPADPEVFLSPTGVPPNWEPMLLRASLSIIAARGRIPMGGSVTRWFVLEVDDSSRYLAIGTSWKSPISRVEGSGYIPRPHSQLAIACRNSRRACPLIGMARQEGTTHTGLVRSSVLAPVKMPRLGAAFMLR